MKYKITRKVFNQICKVESGIYTYNGEHFRRFKNLELEEITDKFGENQLICSFHLEYHKNLKELLPKDNSLLVITLKKIGFNQSRRDTLAYELKIKPEYHESVKNMLILALSEDKDNVALAYQLFKNIAEYSVQKQAIA